MPKKTHPLRAFRRKKKLSYKGVGVMLKKGASTIRAWENGGRTITAENAILIESRIGIPRAILRPDLWGKR